MRKVLLNEPVTRDELQKLPAELSDVVRLLMFGEQRTPTRQSEALTQGYDDDEEDLTPPSIAPQNAIKFSNADDRRREDRVTAHLRFIAVVKENGKTQEFPGHTINLTLHGLRVVIQEVDPEIQSNWSHKLKEGGEIRIVLNLTEEPAKPHFPGRIVWAVGPSHGDPETLCEVGILLDFLSADLSNVLLEIINRARKDGNIL